MTCSVLGNPGTPEALIMLLVTRAEFDILRICLLRELKHSLSKKAVVFQRRENGQEIRSGDARARDIRGEEYSLAKGLIRADVQVFLALGVGASSYEMISTTSWASAKLLLITLDDHDLVFD